MRLAHPARELRAEIRVQHKRVRLVDRDVIADWSKTVTICQRPVDVEQSLSNIPAKMFRCAWFEPRIRSEPGRMDEVVKSNNRFKAVLPALHEHIDITIQRAIVERGRRSRCVNPRGLYATPFNAQTKGIQA